MPTSERHNLLYAGVLFLTTLAVYAAGACRTIYVGDSGELATAVATLGIPHPSGYPLYVLVGKLWTLLLPLGSIAFRLSLFSAACAAGAVTLLYLAARDLEIRPAAAAFAALAAAFAPSFWGEANIQRVYALNAVFVMAATRAALSWWRQPSTPRLALVALLCGLGAGNHTFLAVFALGFAVFAGSHRPELLRRGRELAFAGAAFHAGLLPYLYLPLRSQMNPRLDWGNPETPGALLRVLLRADFWDRAWWRGPEDLPAILGDWLQGLGRESLWGGALLALAGIAWGARTRLPVALPLLVMAGNVGILAAHGSRSDLFVWHRYYIPSFLMLALLAGIGAEGLLRRLPPHTARAAAVATLVLPAALLASGWSRFDRSSYRLAEDYSRTLLAGLPPGAHLAASDDNILFVLLYLHLVEGLRPDVDLIPQGVGQAELPPLRFDPDREPLFFTHHPNWRIPELAVAPDGLAFRVSRSERPAAVRRLAKTELDGESDPRVPKDDLTRNLIAQFHLMRALGFEASDWPAAERELRLAAATAPDNDVLLYNLGLVYRRNGAEAEALAAFERSHTVNPRDLSSGRGVRARDQIEELRHRREQRPPG